MAAVYRQLNYTGIDQATSDGVFANLLSQTASLTGVSLKCHYDPSTQVFSVVIGAMDLTAQQRSATRTALQNLFGRAPDSDSSIPEGELRIRR